MAQVGLPGSGVSVSLSFDDYDGSGIAPSPNPGQLDSDAWAFSGFSDGDSDFGDTFTTGDFAKGPTTGGVTSGGLYAFNEPGSLPSSPALWIQPTGSDFTPGAITLRLQNNTGGNISTLQVAYTIWVLNDNDRANSLNFSYSTDGNTFIELSDLDYTSPGSADGSLVQTDRSTELTGLAWAPGAFFFLRWTSDDVSGGGSRDELGLDDIELTPTTGTAQTQVAFGIPDQTVNEADVLVPAPVTLNQSDTCVVRVFDTGAGSATPGMDYTPLDVDTLFFSPGGMTTQNIEIEILDDMEPESAETVVLSLDSVFGCSIGSIDTFTLTIVSQELPVYPIPVVTSVDADGFPDSLGVSCELRGIVHGINLRPGNGLQFSLINSDNRGIGVFSADEDFGYTVTEGDSLHLFGTIGFFNGLTQINPDSLQQISSGNPLAVPRVVMALDESTESSLVTLEDVSLVDPGQWQSGGSFNVEVTNGTDIFVLRIAGATDISGLQPPEGTFDLIGIGGQFDNAAPYFQGYQILPRYMQDIDPYNEDVPTYVLRELSAVKAVDADGVALLLDSLVEVRGIVYGLNLRGSSGLQFTIKDRQGNGAGAISFAEDFGYTVTEGDSLRILGRVDQFNGLTQIQIDSLFLESSGNPLLAPQTVTALNEDTESRLVRLEGLSLVDPGQWQSSGSFNVDATNGQTTFEIRIDEDTDIAGMPAPSGVFNLVGIGGQFDGQLPFTEGYQIIPRYAMDIDELSSVVNPAWAGAVKLFPNPAGGRLNIHLDLAFEELVVCNSLGQAVWMENEVEGLYQLDLSQWPAGLYTLTLSRRGQIWSTRFLKK